LRSEAADSAAGGQTPNDHGLQWNKLHYLIQNWNAEKRVGESLPLAVGVPLISLFYASFQTLL